MSTNRLEAFSDGVLAIIITIMVLELRAPAGADLSALTPLLPVLGSYIISFTVVGIYWNNHHHLLQATKSVNGNIMWANLFLLFCLSLLPFSTAWLGEHPGALWPTVLYGFNLLLPGFAFRLLVSSIIGLHGRNSAIGQAIGSDVKGYASLFFYVLAIALAFINPWISTRFMRWWRWCGSSRIGEWNALCAMSKYAAFLRGINLGGRTVKMDELRKTLEEAGFKNVKTLLASGNVIFETSVPAAKLNGTIEAQLKKAFGFDIDVILRSESEIQALVKADPFKRTKITPETRLYVSFLSDASSTKPKLPFKALDGEYQILQIEKGNVVSFLTAKKHNTPDVMDLLSKQFGKKITTRNWNTVLKIHAALQIK